MQSCNLAAYRFESARSGMIARYMYLGTSLEEEDMVRVDVSSRDLVLARRSVESAAVADECMEDKEQRKHAGLIADDVVVGRKRQLAGCHTLAGRGCSESIDAC